MNYFMNVNDIPSRIKGIEFNIKLFISNFLINYYFGNVKQTNADIFYYGINK